MDYYCDGSCLGNGKENSFGGWAYACIDKDNTLTMFGSGSMKNTTNNRMELTAFLEAIKKSVLIDDEFPNYYIDSAYIVNCFNQKWYVNWINNGWINSKGAAVKNQDLWEQIFELLSKKNYNIYKVKGHSTNEWNNYVDKMAVNASELLRKEEQC